MKYRGFKLCIIDFHSFYTRFIVHDIHNTIPHILKICHFIRFIVQFLVSDNLPITITTVTTTLWKIVTDQMYKKHNGYQHPVILQKHYPL